jgi:hypothetical protein
MLLPSLLLAPESEGTRESLRLLDVPALWVIVLIVVPLFGLLAWIGYARERVHPAMRVVLTGLRLAAFALLLFVLARPVRVERREEIFAPEVLVLVDDSASMRRMDAYGGDETERAKLEALGGKPPSETSRLELVQRALAAHVLPPLEEEGYDVRLYAFSEALTPLDSPANLSGRGAGTHLGDALTRALATHRGRHVTDVVVLSDGRQNGGLPLTDAARTAAAAGGALGRAGGRRAGGDRARAGSRRAGRAAGAGRAGGARPRRRGAARPRRRGAAADRGRRARRAGRAADDGRARDR